MYTYEINVASKTPSGPAPYSHIFRIKDIPTEEHAQKILEGLKLGFPNCHFTIYRKTEPVFHVILEETT